MKVLITIALLFSSVSYAYNEGEYSCRNADVNLPNNTYIITTTDIGGVDLPVVEMKRHFADTSDKGFYEIAIKGIAEVSTNGNTQILSLNHIRLEFVGDQLQNCRE